MQMNNLAELLYQWRNQPQKILYRQYQEGAWRDHNADSLLHLVGRWQAAYRNAGLQAGDRVALCMKNGIYWVAADLAALASGLVVVPLYADDNAENQAWCIENSGAKLLVADHLRFLSHFQSHLGHLPTIVLVRGEAVTPVVALDAWLPEDGPLTIIEQPGETLATIVYTSGTMGRPKGVMLSHANILANLEGILDAYEVYENDSLLSVLPLSHMFERTGGYYLPLKAGAVVTYCRGINELASDLVEQQPTIVMAVPRLFERMLARIEERIKSSPLKRWLFFSAARAGWRRFRGEVRWHDGLVLHSFYPLIAKPLAARLGGRIRKAVMGGAALDQRVAQTFIGLGVPLLQGYGLTEAAPVVAVNREDNNDPASVGEPLPNVECRLSEQSELLVRGPNVMLGYWDNDEATQKIIDAEGWLNTGDVVEIREKRIYIRGRSKNILVLSNGEKIAPEDIEAAVARDAAFDQVMVAGEGRPYLVLLAVSREGDEQALLRRVNAQMRHLPRYARIRRVIRLDEPWSVENGLLTPTLKIRRAAILDRYREKIEAVYAEPKV
ncbi:MAG TPA: long-chain fatty acid--CoA ligase [Methylophilaceae bacterium]|nr:long-chain fatty acid--CoA ligase [Methylophilaceae bacterium]